MSDERATVTVDGVTWTKIHGGWWRHVRETPGTPLLAMSRHHDAALDRIAALEAEVLSLRADADAVRAVQQWEGAIEVVRVGAQVDWFAKDAYSYVASGESVYSLGRALIARQQQEEEGK